MTQHPIRNANIRTYVSERWGWIAQFDDGRVYPIVFRGRTEAEVIDRASGFRGDVIAAHEDAYLKRRDAAKKARLAREKNAGAA